MPKCGDCKFYLGDDEAGMCVMLSDKFPIPGYGWEGACVNYERRLTMEKQPTENITIPVWRYDLFVKAEAMLELARKIHRNSDQYEAKKNLMIVFGADEEPCETI